MPLVRANGTDLYCETSGDGPGLVFIHGENHGIELFSAQVAQFSGDYRCLTYYRRGHGRSASPLYGYSVWNQTLDLQALLDELGFDDAVLVAVAMSTPIAVTYTSLNPPRVRGLVLASWYELDGYPHLEQRRRAVTTFPELNLAMHAVREQEGQAGLEAFVARMAESEFPIMPEAGPVRSMLVRMFASHPPERYLQAAEFYTSLPHLVPKLREVKCPILGICGEDDPSPDRPELLDGVAHFRQAWIKGARRFPSVERPVEFNAVLAGWLGSLS